MAFAAGGAIQVYPFNLDQGEGVPPVTWVAGNLAFATSRFRARHTSVGAHIPGTKVLQPHREPAAKRPMSLRRSRAVHTPADPLTLPTPPATTPGGRTKFRVVAASGISGNDKHAHDDPVLIDAHGGKHEVPHPPTEPKPERGLRPRLRTPAASQQAEETGTSGQAAFPCARFSRQPRCGLGLSLDGVIAMFEA